LRHTSSAHSAQSKNTSCWPQTRGKATFEYWVGLTVPSGTQPAQRDARWRPQSAMQAKGWRRSRAGVEAHASRALQRKSLKFSKLARRGAKNGPNLNGAEGRAAALCAHSARHNRGPCRIQCGRRWLLRRICHLPMLLLRTMLIVGWRSDGLPRPCFSTLRRFFVRTGALARAGAGFYTIRKLP
jgi:hypothetical protein